MAGSARDDEVELGDAGVLELGLMSTDNCSATALLGARNCWIYVEI